jgi:hypothetical protein
MLYEQCKNYETWAHDEKKKYHQALEKLLS